MSLIEAIERDDDNAVQDVLERRQDVSERGGKGRLINITRFVGALRAPPRSLRLPGKRCIFLPTLGAIHK